MKGSVEDVTLAVRHEPDSDSRHSLLPPTSEVLGVLWRRCWLLVKITAAGLLISVVTAFVLPKRYESTTRLMPPDNQVGSQIATLAALSGDAAGLGMFGDLLGFRSSGALFVGILRSRTAQDHLITRFDLRQVYGTQKMEDSRIRLSRATTILEDRKSGIISITVADSQPERAAALARGYVEELDRIVAELSTSAAHRERVFIEERLHVVKNELDEAAKQLSEFASKNATIDPQFQGRAMVDAAANLQGRLIAAESELQALRQIYTDNAVRVRVARARVTELRRQLEKLGSGDTSSTDGRDNTASDSTYPSIRRFPILGVTYADLYRRVKVQEAIYESLTKQYEVAKVQEAKEIPSVRVLDVADVPEYRSAPNRHFIVYVGTLFSFALAVVYVLGQAYWEELDTAHPGKVLARESWERLGDQARRWSAHPRVRPLVDRFRRLRN